MRSVTNSEVVKRVGAEGRIEAGRSVERSRSEVLRRAVLLRGADRMMIEMALRGAPVRSIAEAVGVPATSVHRRVRRIGERLHSPVVGVLVSEGCAVAAEYRQIGIEFFLVGMSEREIADKHRMARREVGRVVEFLRGWAGARMKSEF